MAFGQVLKLIENVCIGGSLYQARLGFYVWLGFFCPPPPAVTLVTW